MRPGALTVELAFAGTALGIVGANVAAEAPLIHDLTGANVSVEKVYPVPFGAVSDVAVERRLPDTTSPEVRTMQESRQWARRFAADPVAASSLSLGALGMLKTEINGINTDGTMRGVTIISSASGEGRDRDGDPSLNHLDSENARLALRIGNNVRNDLIPLAKNIQGQEVPITVQAVEHDSPELKTAIEDMAKQEGKTATELVQIYNRGPEELPNKVRDFLDGALKAQRYIQVDIIGEKREHHTRTTDLYIPLIFPVNYRRTIEEGIEPAGVSRAIPGGAPPPTPTDTTKLTIDVPLPTAPPIEAEGLADQRQRPALTVDLGLPPTPTVSIPSWNRPKGLRLEVPGIPLYRKKQKQGYPGIANDAVVAAGFPASQKLEVPLLVAGPTTPKLPNRPGSTYHPAEQVPPVSPSSKGKDKIHRHPPNQPRPQNFAGEPSLDRGRGGNRRGKRLSW